MSMQINFRRPVMTGIFLVLVLSVSPAHADPPWAGGGEKRWSRGHDKGYERTYESGHERGHERPWAGSDWRLGDYNQILMRTERGWRRVPGSAIAVGDGWVIGTDRRPGGFGIYRWDGYEFRRMPGGAVEIGGTYHQPWVINDQGEQYVWTGHDWREVHRARDYRQKYYDRSYDRKRYHEESANRGRW